jgi:hypothetical protein
MRYLVLLLPLIAAGCADYDRGYAYDYGRSPTYDSRYASGYGSYNRGYYGSENCGTPAVWRACPPSRWYRGH